ncbi:MAG: TonB-dependent receptor [Sphingomonadaceae bacterium]|nr:TonB-dependent receptor [Sphingomonadaceae bacterium]NCA01651.1 TonB-dependent receptor [Sphingomonadaceae bacterium]
MKQVYITGVSAFAMLMATPALAQSAQDDAPGADEIIVTAQRQAQSLQEVPIAVSAFSAETLERQQIKNASDLQLTLPNVTFTKGNFTGSSFTIRGIGDLCVGVTCDSATAIHLDGTPLLATRLFETEYFDLERVEVLRGPQGTLFGRNATSGVVNFVPVRPDLTGFKASGEVEYGNYNSVKAKGMLNVALNDTLGVRVAGFYLNRDGYTQNIFDGSRMDDRNMYAVRGSVRWEPSESTTVDLMGYYFRENDNRMRIQKQMCQRDPTGVLGCLPNSRQYGMTNANSTFVGTLSSREFLTLNRIPVPALGLGSVYGPDVYAGVLNPADPRVVNTDHKPTYFTSEQQFQARINQELGKLNLQLTGFYHTSKVDSSQDYNLSVQNRAVMATGLGTLAALATTAGPLQGLLKPIYDALTPNGPSGSLCTSLPETTGTGSYGGYKVCSATPQDFDRSNQSSKDWSVEGILTSDLDGKLNFLLGGIYADYKMTENSYYVNSFGIDYVTGILGTFTAAGAGLPPSYLATPYYRNNSDDLHIKSYGLFGEAYYEFNDDVKLTFGVRYNNDKKAIKARTTLASFLTPFGSANAYASPFFAAYDADPGKVGPQPFQERNVGFNETTGRVVLDWKLSEDNLIYISASRGYKSGGINPPLTAEIQSAFNVPEAFKPETVNAFEIGSKNVFANGMFTLNATAFYYQYKGLQLSRIVARTSVNDNVDADIYGVELESLIRPSRDWLFNLNASYLHTKAGDTGARLFNPRDPSGGRADAVIIKDITNGANCVALSTSGSAAGVNSFVTTINSAVGLKAPTDFGPNSGVKANGAFGICSALTAQAKAVGAAFGGVEVLAGVPVNIKGNKLPQAPNYKFSIGGQYTAEMSNGMTIVPRADLTYTGESYGNIFNGPINKIQGYTQANAQVQLNGPDGRWFVRGYIQNIFDSASITGLYVTDQSSGNYTNIFTLEPRRYGLAAGFKF